MIRRAIEWYIEIWDRIATRLILIEQRLRDKLAEPEPEPEPRTVRTVLALVELDEKPKVIETFRLEGEDTDADVIARLRYLNPGLSIRYVCGYNRVQVNLAEPAPPEDD